MDIGVSPLPAVTLTLPRAQMRTWGLRDIWELESWGEGTQSPSRRPLHLGEIYPITRMLLEGEGERVYGEQNGA